MYHGRAREKQQDLETHSISTLSLCQTAQTYTKFFLPGCSASLFTVTGLTYRILLILEIQPPLVSLIHRT